MRRSEINQLIQNALSFLKKNHFHLPKWAEWTFKDWQQHKELTTYLTDRQMGWDVTDFGGSFKQTGAVLFCLRNGKLHADAKNYAEKIMIVNANQQIPFHFHANKMEDIIVRAGGNLVLEFYLPNKDSAQISLLSDGEKLTCDARMPLVLSPGQSVTIPPGIMHRFYGKSEPVLVGEVSEVNDDTTDNYFAKPCPRFAKIIEDAPINYYLWTDLAKVELCHA